MTGCFVMGREAGRQAAARARELAALGGRRAVFLV